VSIGSALPVGGRGMKEESPARWAAGVTPAPGVKKTRKSAQRIFSRLRDGQK